jgi:hypothetical protein
MDEQGPKPPADGTQPARAAPGWLGALKGKPSAVVGVVVVGLLVLCGGGAFAVVRVGGDGQQRAALWDVGPSGGASAGASAGPAATAGGPRAANTAVREDDDLAKVCDGWYFPKSPKFGGKAPHQISVGVVDSTTLTSRHVMSSVDVPDTRNWRAWMPENPAKTQLVGCVDLVGTGATVKSCKFDDPKPQTIALARATYRVRLFEAATGRKLLDRPAVDGGDVDCPSVVFLAGGESLVTEVSDRQLYDLFRAYVMKKL